MRAQRSWREGLQGCPSRVSENAALSGGGRQKARHLSCACFCPNALVPLRGASCSGLAPSFMLFSTFTLHFPSSRVPFVPSVPGPLSHLTQAAHAEASGPMVSVFRHPAGPQCLSPAVSSKPSSEGPYVMDGAAREIGCPPLPLSQGVS